MLYNAIGRHEYLRAWSYFQDGAAAPFPEFEAGHADTAGVELRVGNVESEGAAGSIHSTVPVAIRTTDGRGRVTVFTGCYCVVQVNPAI